MKSTHMKTTAENKLIVPAIAAILCLAAFGCGRRESYSTVERGAAGTHGMVTNVKTYNYTPEQLEARDKALGYQPQPPQRPKDERLATIQDLWPQLTEEQRAKLVETAREMTGSKP